MGSQRPRNIAEGSPLRGSPWTAIGPGSLVKGDLLMAGDVIVYGRVEGMIYTDGDVWVAPGGEVFGGVHARRVVVEGHCHGRIEGLEATSLRAGSVVHAEVVTPALVVDPMARYIEEHLPRHRSLLPEIHTYQTQVGGKA